MEGPSIVILKKQVAPFKGKKIFIVNGNSKIDQQRLLNQKVIAFKSWGKHFLICFKDFFLRVHFLMFGSYRVNEEKALTPPRLSLIFKNGELNLYTCSVKIIEGNANDIYDWETDIMADEWNALKALKKLKTDKNALVCDVLLNQAIFSGVGNIIKNEVLFRIKVHPESKIGALPLSKRRQLVEEARNYSFDFLKWKKKFELKKHWKIYNKKICPDCEGPVTRTNTGKYNRRSFFCRHCQNYINWGIIYPVLVLIILPD